MWKFLTSTGNASVIDESRSSYYFLSHFEQLSFKISIKCAYSCLSLNFSPKKYCLTEFTYADVLC